MGLDIHGSVTKKTWHASYSGLHHIRRLALFTLGFPDTVGGKDVAAIFPICYFLPEKLTASELVRVMEIMLVAGHIYPNLMLHSDCEGNYTKNGKINPQGDWMKGNSIGLLNELKNVRIMTDKKHRDSKGWELLISLYELLEDEIKNGKGTIRFS